jgi:hypothetical protein
MSFLKILGSMNPFASFDATGGVSFDGGDLDLGVNPGSGLPMLDGGLDVAGNPFGSGDLLGGPDVPDFGADSSSFGCDCCGFGDY